jgi:hypothetical protein
VNARHLWLDSTIAHNLVQVKVISERARSRGYRVLVHSQVHLEQSRQVRVEKKAAFRIDLMDRLLVRHGIEVFDAHLNKASAESFAEILAKRFPSRADWQTAKMEAIKAQLGPSAVVGNQPPMTTDWLVALEVERDPTAIIVTDDQGPEWNGLRQVSRALTYVEAMATLANATD